MIQVSAPGPFGSFVADLYLGFINAGLSVVSKGIAALTPSTQEWLGRRTRKDRAA